MNNSRELGKGWKPNAIMAVAFFFATILFWNLFNEDGNTVTWGFRVSWIFLTLLNATFAIAIYRRNKNRSKEQ